jgi:hypothetical protein
MAISVKWTDIKAPTEKKKKGIEILVQRWKTKLYTVEPKRESSE